jgi:hypothetical protein
LEIKTKTELKSLEWNESPTMTVMGKNIPVTYLINPAVKFLDLKLKEI